MKEQEDQDPASHVDSEDKKLLEINLQSESEEPPKKNRRKDAHLTPEFPDNPWYPAG
jgi:hypothetical protein